MRVFKTKQIKVIQCYCYNHWYDEVIYDRSEYKNIKHDLEEYRKSGFGPYRVITRRVPR